MARTSTTSRHEAVVLGSGPAGLSLAVALREAGVDAVCVAPRFGAWPANYGLWTDEVADLDLVLEARWKKARIAFPDSEPRDLEREYGKLDGARQSELWIERLGAENALIHDRASSAFFRAQNWQILLDSGSELASRLCFDATGHRPKFVQRRPTSPAFQVAFGVKITSDVHTLGDDTMGLMDWHNGIEFQHGDHRFPAFFYEMPVSSKISLVELTILCARPKVPIAALRERLFEDLVERGFELEKIIAKERVFIPMGHSLPDLEQPIVGFGGAASMVHPATGYMVARVFRQAHEVAEAAVATRNEAPQAAARALWNTIWPGWRQRTRALHQFGLEAMLSMSPAQIYAFFEAFFDLPQPQWAGFLSDTLEARELAAVMLGLYRSVGADVRSVLRGRAIGAEGGKLAARLLGLSGL